MQSSILIRNARAVFQTEPSDIPLRGERFSRLTCTCEAYILIENGIIKSIGPVGDAPHRADTILDASDRYVLPCWCDSHSHLVFAASREAEFVDRIHGLSYEEIAERGGGILNSASKLADTPEQALLTSAQRRLGEVINFGTGALEIKSGYGLSTESELKMLRVIRRLKESAPIPIKATFLGAHAFPVEYRSNRSAYIDLLINEMLPKVAGDGLADYIDVFCDQGFFTPEETDRILSAGLLYGLKPKIHCNQLSISGGVQVGVNHGAVSVDHLEQVGNTEIELLGSSRTIATLLPSCSFFLDIPYAPARKLIQSGAAIALATDFNPGSTPSGKIPFVISLACIKMGMTPQEAINATTINGAHAMEMAHIAGVVAVGRTARLIITRPIPSIDYLPYAFGSDHIEHVILSNEIISPGELPRQSDSFF